MDTQPQPAIEKVPVKKRRTWYWWLLGIVVVIILAVAWTGVYQIPVASAIMGANKPKDLGVKVSDAAMTSLQTKIATKITGAAIDYNSPVDQIFSGTVPVDTQNTSEEITTWLAKRAGTNAPVTNVQVCMIEGGVEVSGLLHKYVNAPAYAKVMITRTGEKSVSLQITEAKVGKITVPQKYLTQAQDWFTKQTNSRMASIPGFSMTQLEYHAGYNIFKGTMPATARPAAGGWSDLLLK